ncbi:bifunctional diguanylate cyclase/phosphodiesterase [Lacimicrobium alkaliphilum]|uniref:GGDEF domain-containing protein n=1 Tax=Lacimicrobium alkaliphilum TaxID=1526571 RepID=A0ABQ1RNT4_9ALTE|nr:EAL domain-containing protein [Lacimicrobium alkaliphilum]GGD76796.1 GGDEF domain-containing protein [Lacimicrobium alkaliphilum]
MRIGLSLKAQLYGLLLLVLTLSYTGALYVNIDSFREYQAKQLTSHAQDAAHNLGLAISPHLGESELVLAETMTNAIFDSGYYQQISFTDTNDVVRFSRQHEGWQSDAPKWFRDLFPLQAPVMQSEVANGWVPGGVLSVQSHVGYAYDVLWQSAVSLLLQGLWLLVATGLVTYLILRAVLRPLSALRNQAQAVMRKEYKQLPALPFTLELRTLTRAFNQMVGNTERTFNEQAGYAETLSEQLYRDPLTGLANRQALQLQFETQKTEAREHGDSLYLALIHLSSLQPLNEQAGYQAGDNYLLKCVALMQQQLAGYPQCSLYRLSGSDLALMCRLDENSMQLLQQKMKDAFNAQAGRGYPKAFAHMFGTKVKGQERFHDVLTRLDTLYLTQNDRELAPQQVDQGHSRQQWQQLLSQFTVGSSTDKQITRLSDFDALTRELQQHYEIKLQPVLSGDGQVLYSESLVRFNWQQQPLSTAATFAMAERLQCTAALEKSVLCYLFSQLTEYPQYPVGINLTDALVLTEEHQQWLLALLGLLKDRLPPLVLEIKESALVSPSPHLGTFLHKLHKLNIKICIEHFGAHLSAFKTISNLPIDYVKIDGGFIRDIYQPANQLFVRSLTQICHGVGIQVLASHVESAEIGGRCLHMHLDGLQGKGVAQPLSISQCYKNLMYSDPRVGLELASNFRSTDEGPQ